MLIIDVFGLVVSCKYRGVFYIYNDSEYLINYVFVINVLIVVLIFMLMVYFFSNFDWEDIVVGFCGSISCIYIVDMGIMGIIDVYCVEEFDFIYLD